jgi:hypothetical protein
MFTSYDKRRGTYLLLLKADEFLRDRSIVAALRAYPGMVVGMSPQLGAPGRQGFRADARPAARSGYSRE